MDKRVSALEAAPQSVNWLGARLREIEEHNWRLSFLAHTSDTARFARLEIKRLTNRVQDLEAQLKSNADEFFKRQREQFT